jgi:hypothetical protein
VVDLAYHLVGEARRALVALATPAGGPLDTTAVDYWRPFRPSRPGDADGLWPTRAAASLMGGFDVVRRAHAEAAEAAVHHLAIVAGLDRPGPAAAPLAEVRRVLEGLYGGLLPADWDDASLARWGTGREPLTGAARAQLGGGAEGFPLFG